ncbi:MAG: glycosyltransferase [Bacillota bacterium]|nr:glycosyltransferase [Bacillota bacterium]
MGEAKRVAILAVRFGAGHWQAAQALKEALEQTYPGVQVDVVNYLKFAGFFFDWLTRLGYHDLMIHMPRLYRRFFAYTNQLRPGSLFQKFICTCGARRFRRYLRRANPVLLISTFPVPAAVAANLKRRGLVRCPLVTVVTDYTLHQQWIQPGTDLYIVANEVMAGDLICRKIPPHQVAATGIPIDPRFETHPGKKLPELLPGLPPASEGLPLVFVLNGATCFRGDLPRLCRLLADFPVPLVGVVAGVRHPRQRFKLRRLVKKGRNKVLILGFTKEVPSFMGAASCLVSKAGGLTMSEALAMELPVVIYRPLPCQEESNRAFLVAAGAALAAQNISELSECLRRVLKDAHLRTEMKQAASRLKKPAAARAVARLLEPYLS